MEKKRICFEINIKPVTKKNPVPTGRRGHSIKHPKQKAYEDELTMLLKSKRDGFHSSGPVEITWISRHSVPKSINGKRLKKDERSELEGFRAGCIDPDLDNLAKPLLDSIVRAGFIDDDNQVVKMTASKRFCLDCQSEGFYVWIQEV